MNKQPLTIEQYSEKINTIFCLINELAEDKEFQALLTKVNKKDCDDYVDADWNISSLCENLIDTAKNSFQYYN